MTTISKQMSQITNAQKHSRPRYSDAELLFFKKIIESKIIEASKVLDGLNNSLQKNPHSGDEQDTSSRVDYLSTQNEASLNALIKSKNKFILSLNNALIKIGNKTYGICKETKVLIPKNRLKLVPHATLSVEGKNIRNEREERERNSFIPKTA